MHVECFLTPGAQLAAPPAVSPTENRMWPCGARNLSSVPTEHPVEFIVRIRDLPDSKDRTHNPLIDIPPDGRSIKVHTDIGYRDFPVDGVSFSENENLDVFYTKFVKSLVEGVRVGSQCTIVMCGPTGSGKSHTMFGRARETGIVYRALKDIIEGGANEQGDLGGEEADETGFKLGIFVRVAVLEIYNEQVYDLLSANLNDDACTNVYKGNSHKAQLEIIGKKAKNLTYLSGNEAGKILLEVAKVEKRLIVKSTLCNERSSRSHCMIILDVPSVGGRLMLVDMAGPENIEAAGQSKAKRETCKLNQGNISLKRVVESITNGNSHVPYRDSKMTMLLEDSLSDDESKTLMILCASLDPCEMHKTISTLEYCAKAKCIVRAAHPATRNPSSSQTSQIPLLNQEIGELLKERDRALKERDQALKSLSLKDDEIESLQALKSLKDDEIDSLKKILAEVVKLIDQVIGPSEPSSAKSPITKVVKPVSPLCPREVRGVGGGEVEVYVKWEVSKDSWGLIKELRVPKDWTLSSLRSELEACCNQDFVFLLLRDPFGGPVAKEMEADMPVTKLPECNKFGHRLASLRPLKKGVQ